MRRYLIFALLGISLTACATTNPPVKEPDIKETPEVGAPQRITRQDPPGRLSLVQNSSKLTHEDSNELDITGSIDKEAIRSTIRNQSRKLFACYAKATQKDRKTKGKIVISWDIADTGKVKKSSVYSNDTGDEELAQCVRKELAKLTYEKPAKGQSARILYPFAFSPAGELMK